MKERVDGVREEQTYIFLHIVLADDDNFGHFNYAIRVRVETNQLQIKYRLIGAQQRHPICFPLIPTLPLLCGLVCLFLFF